MSLQHESKRGVLVICFTDARILDESRIRKLGDELIELLGRTDDEKVLLDFRHVDFMSSAMLGTIVRMNKKCKEYKAKLKLCSIAPEILKVFKITKLDKLLDIESDEEAALAAFNKRGFFG
jgi:anti-anti-sigma factor